jgi:ATP-dependent DNA ligase
VVPARPRSRAGEHLVPAAGRLGNAAQDRRHPRHHLPRGTVQPKDGKYYAFDLPEAPGDLDDRFRALCKLAALQSPDVVVVDSYGGHFARIYATLARDATEGVVFKRRSSAYAKQPRASAETRDWLKRRFAWD